MHNIREKIKPTLNKNWSIFLLIGVAVLAAAVFATSGIKIPDSGFVASVIDVITDTSTSTTEVTPLYSAPAESAPTAPTGISIFQDILEVFLPPLSIENPVPAAPKIVPRLNVKVFVLVQDALESEVNSWFAVQEGIVADQISVQDYGGGGYIVVISYHTGGTGNSSTRLKIIEGENSEADAQSFLSSLGASQTVRSITAVAGSYSNPEKTVTVPIIFIVYE